MNEEERRRTFREELTKLEEKQYIEKDSYSQVLEAHNQYYNDFKNKHQEAKADKAKKLIQPTKPKKVKKTLSPQAVRERNITWSLVLGVVLLLIGGLVLATSTWDTLTDWKKTGMIAFVSVLFFGLAYFTRRVLKIEKTAFAFHVLGSLFLPIVILSAGYFELLGSYLSFTGDGRYLYGAAGSLVILPVYLLLAVRMVSRLFVWFSYVTLTVLAGFLIASLNMPVDVFYLGIMAFNAVLIIGYHYVRKQARFQLFTKEFVSYIQANLILSTLLMLVLYDNEMIYSFNLFLTATLYLSMIYVTKLKEYHIVFSVMLVYGAYQLIEFSALNEIEAIAYALLGVVFIVLPYVLKDSSLTAAFQYTSAVVSFFAFLFISLQGILLNMNEPSLVLLVAYSIIALNFAYLSNKVKRTLFHYLSPVFIMAAFYELILIGREVVEYGSLNLPVFIAGALLYSVFGCLMRVNFFKEMKASSRDVGGIVMLLSIVFSYGLTGWWQVGTMFALLAVIALFMEQFETRIMYTNIGIASWAHAVSIGLAVVTYFKVDQVSQRLYYNTPVEAENWVLAGIIVLLASFLWKKWKRPSFCLHSFYAAEWFYATGVWLTFAFTFDDSFRALIVLGGVGMAYLLYRKTRWKTMPYVISAISLLFHFTVLYAISTQFNIQSELYQSLKLVTGALLLLGTGTIIGKMDTKLMKSFWWIGHLYLPISLTISLLFYGDKAIWAFLLATIIYGVSVQKAGPKWMANTFLYLAFTSFWIFVSLVFYSLDLSQHVHYAFLITSAVLGAGWYFSSGDWKRRIAFYAVPFTIIGISVFVLVDPYDITLLAITALYAIGLLIILHKEKWDIFNVIPLILVYYGLVLYSSSHLEWEYSVHLVITGFVLILTIAAMPFYRVIFQGVKEKGEMPVIDWYTIVGFMAICSLYALQTDALWTKLLPGLLLSGNLLLQRERISVVEPKWIVFLACAYLLQPYYTILGDSQLPALFERELYVLPWVVLAIFMQKVAGPLYKGIVNHVQWAVLVIVSVLLIQDGMASSTIQDALIIGILALASILGGMVYQIKSFFFVGAGVLLLNVFLQTRPYWGNLPWWVYLLVAGSILITVASYNEWHKQKSAEGTETWISRFNKKVIQKIKKWQ